MTTLNNEDPADPSVHEHTPTSHIQQNRKALTSSLPIVLDAIDDERPGDGETN